jgi:SulP family sulfate permease
MKRWRTAHPPSKAGAGEEAPVGRWHSFVQMFTSMSALVTILVFTPVAYLLSEFADIDLKVVGEQPAGLPPLSAPDIGLACGTPSMLVSALVISVVAFIESFAVAQAVASEAERIDANQEFIAYGAASPGRPSHSDATL